MEKDLIRDAKNKAARFCAYRERAPLEVREKLGQFGLNKAQVTQVLNELTSENFLNEYRFAHSYVRGKFRLKKWGRIKIKAGLQRYDLDEKCVMEVLEKIPSDQYQEILVKLIEKKWQSLKVEDPFVRKHKVAQFVISKGFEPDLAWEVLKKL